MTYETLEVGVDGPVATITLNRPERLNAISAQLFDELETALAELNHGDEVRVIRVKGAGRAFCSGYDLAPGETPFAPPRERRANPGEGLAEQGESRIARDRDALAAGTDRWLRIWSYRKPIIGQVHGYCLSGGLDLLACCDVVYAGDDASFGHPAARGMGIPVTLGMLPVKIGAQATKELLFTGDTIDAEEARSLGLVRRVFASDTLETEATARCRRMALNALDALTAHKHVTNRWAEVMGLRLAVREGADFDAIFHETPSLARFEEIVRSQGLKAALSWRDGPYDD